MLMMSSLIFAVTIKSWKLNYPVGNSAWIKVENRPNNNQDWVGVYPAGSNNEWKNVVKWSWAKDTSKSKDPGDWYEFEGLANGEYEARFFLNNTFVVEDTIAFSVGTLAMKTSKTNYAEKEKVSVTIKGGTLSGDRDWIGIYPKGASSAWGDVIAWNWAKRGTTTLSRVNRPMPEGEYEVRLFFHNATSNDKIEAKHSFTVSDRVNISTSKNTYNPNENIVVEINNQAEDNQNWVAIYPKNASNAWKNQITWNWTKGKKSVTLNHVPSGQYEARLFYNNSFELEAKSGFSVKGSVKKYPPNSTMMRREEVEVNNPNKLEDYIDRAFNDNVVRVVTRITDRENNNKYPRQQYPKQGSAWNSDMSLLRVGRRVYDATTFKEIPLTKKSQNVDETMKKPQSGTSGIRWSKHNPNVLYVMSGDNKFYELTISADRTALKSKVIYDLKHTGRVEFNIGQNEGNIDYADRYVVLSSEDEKGTQAVLLNIQSKRLVWGPKKINSQGKNVDWITVSPSGKYILVSIVNYGIDLYDRNLNFIRKLANRAEHGDIGYDESGHEMYVQFHSGGVGVFGFVLNNNPQYVKPIKLLDSNYGGGHITCRNYKRKGWCYLGVRGEKYREIFALKLDGSKTVQHFAQTHEPNDWHPTQNVSPDGTRMIFISDFHRGLHGNPNQTYWKRDTYHVKLKRERE